MLLFPNNNTIIENVARLIPANDADIPHVYSIALSNFVTLSSVFIFSENTKHFARKVYGFFLKIKTKLISVIYARIHLTLYDLRV